jgi:tRNA 2-thiouridine synthesizing protein E
MQGIGDVELNVAPRLGADGFLGGGEHWDEATARWLAAQEGIELDQTHWEILWFLRDYYLRFRHVPANLRLFVTAVKHGLGPDQGTSRHLYRLFPNGPLRQACRIAGLPRPPHCLG